MRSRPPGQCRQEQRCGVRTKGRERLLSDPAHRPIGFGECDPYEGLDRPMNALRLEFSDDRTEQPLFEILGLRDFSIDGAVARPRRQRRAEFIVRTSIERVDELPRISACSAMDPGDIKDVDERISRIDRVTFNPAEGVFVQATCPVPTRLRQLPRHHERAAPRGYTNSRPPRRELPLSPQLHCQGRRRPMRQRGASKYPPHAPGRCESQSLRRQFG